MDSVIRFSVFEADVHARELRKQGLKIKLADQPFSILAMLLDRPGQVVTREELQKQLWPADTFVDFDRGLNKAINRLRDALGDSAESPRFIETLPKRGYRFVGAVAKSPPSAPEQPVEPPIEQHVEPPSPEDQPSPEEQRRARASWSAVAWGGALVLLVSVVVFLMYVRRPVETEPIVRSSLLPPPDTSFVPHSFALSPGGSHLAFVAETPDGSLSLWVRALSGSAAQPLKGTDGASLPFWSPDQRRIGFFADRKLKTVDIAGGTVRVIADAARASGGTWNASDVIVFAPDVNGPLYRVPATGGPLAPVTPAPHANGRQGHRWPFFLPDGRHFLYVALGGPTNVQDSASIFVGSLDSSDPTLIMSEGARSVAFAFDHLLFVRGSTLQAQPFDSVGLRTTGPPVSITDRDVAAAPVFYPSEFSISQTGLLAFQSSTDVASQLTWIDPSGKTITRLSEVTYGGPSLSPDGHLLASSCDALRNGTLSICVYDLTRGVVARVTPGPNDRYPVWSRDGKEIAYASVAGIYRVSADGSTSPEPVSKRGTPTDWSHDGQILSFGSQAGPVVSLALSSITTHAVTELGPGSEGQFSPDGHWLAHGGQDGIIVQRFPDRGPRVQVTSYGAWQPRWSRDGKQLFYITTDKKLMAADFDPSTATAGTPRVLFQTRIIGSAFTGFQYDVAPDGRFLVNSMTSPASPLTLVTGWAARLKR